MPSEYGLRIKNSSGDTQVDGVFKNLCHFGTFSTVPAVMQGTFYWDASLGIPYGDAVPLIAFRTDSPSCYFTLVSMLRDGDNWEGFVMLKYNTTPYLTYPDVYTSLFVSEPQQPEPDYGLIVKNVLGQTVFHSDENYLRIVGVYSGSLAFSDSPNYHDITVGSAGHYFICVPGCPMYTWYDGSSYFARCKGILRVGPTMIRYGIFDLPLGDAGVVCDATWSDTYKILEVTSL